MSTDIILSDGTTTLELHRDLYWEDEFGWSSVEQTVERTLTGALLVSLGVRQYGRPITLRSHDDRSAWLTRADMAQLALWAEIPGRRLTLILRGQTHSVIFRHHEGPPFEARPVVFYSDAALGDYVLATIRFITVSPE